MAVKIYNVGMKGIRLREQGVFVPPPELVVDAGSFIDGAGGYYAGANIIVGSKEYAIIIAPKELGENSSVRWKTSITATSEANSTYDGKANMSAIEAAGLSNHPAAEYCANLDINGFNDWHLPAPDELEICYRYLKPNTQINNTSTRPLDDTTNGTNPNSNPMGSGYTRDDPSQTEVGDFRSGGSQAFELAYYWTSMEYSSPYACSQALFSGGQTGSTKRNFSPLRAVRWLEV